MSREKKKPDYTQEWTDKTNGENYNNTLNYYSIANLNWNMYNGNHWVGITADELPKLTMNIYRTATEYIIASIMSKPIVAKFAPDNIEEPPPDDTSPEAEEKRRARNMVELLNKASKLKWEKEKMPYRLRQCFLLDAACSGDMCAHVYWDSKADTKQLEKGDFRVEVIDGGNVHFGNPNVDEVEKQPYIVIVGRALVEDLKREAEDYADENGTTKQDRERIMSDADTDYMIGEGKNELEGNNEEAAKATYVIKYWRDRKTGRIFWNKSTKSCPIRKNVDTGLSRYPVAWGHWQKRKNCFHGAPIGNGLIDNQIAINQLFALVAYWAKMNAFGKVIIDSARIQNWSNKIGEVIKADGNVDGIVKQLEGGSFNTAMLTIIDMAIKYTKDFIGANDAALGQINPERASGTAIMLTAKQAAIPHANIETNLYQFIEDLYLIWAEFYTKRYQSRKLFYKGDNGMASDEYDADALKDVILSCEVDVGQSTLWSDVTEQQNLAALLTAGIINKTQFFERVNDNYVPDTAGLLRDAKLEEMLQAEGQRVIDEATEVMKGLDTGQAPQAGQNNASMGIRQNAQAPVMPKL
jgi:hypothetical protein